MSDSKGCQKSTKTDYFQLTRFCFFFTLRQGTLVIAVTELATAMFALIILAVCAERAEDIFMEAAADQPESGEEAVMSAVFRWEWFTNAKNMQKGLQLGTLMLFFLYVALVLTTTHLLTCLLLLYGTIKGFSKLMLPWLCTVTLSIGVALFFLMLFAFIPYHGCKGQLYVAALLVVTIQIHSWLVVFGHYQETINKRVVRVANNLLFAYEQQWGVPPPGYTPIPTKEIIDSKNEKIIFQN